MKIISTFLLVVLFTCCLTAQTPQEYLLPAWDIETDKQGNLFAAYRTEVFQFDLQGNVVRKILENVDSSFGTIEDFNIGADGKMYLNFEFLDGIYRLDTFGNIRKVLSGEYLEFDVDANGGICASLYNGGTSLFRYKNDLVDTVLVIDEDINVWKTIENIEVDTSNTFWISYQGGLLSYGNNTLRRYSNERVIGLYVNSNQTVHLAVGDGRLAYKLPNDDTIYEVSTNEAQGAKVCADSEGRIYSSINNIAYIYSDNNWNTVQLSDDNTSFPIQFEVDIHDNVFLSTRFGEMYIWSNTTGTAQIIKQDPQLLVYPNPSDQFIQLNGDLSPFQNQQFEILSSKGHRVMHGLIDLQPINIENLSKGLYYLNIIESGKLLKFIK